ncbi:MAG: Rab family GTPase [Candidatus Hodarchaeales archaeon]
MSKLFKIILLGDGSVGKTTSVRQYMDEKFAKNYSPTIGVDVTKISIAVNNNLNKKPEKVTITVWDIAGQETFKSFRRTFYNGATAGILMFDVTVKESFHHIKDWLHEAQTEIGEQVPFILVGNKIDLKRKRKINIKEMQLLQQEHQNIVMIYETSAKANKNIRELFKSIAETVLKDDGREDKKKAVIIQSNPEKQSTKRKKVASARRLPNKIEKN